MMGGSKKETKKKRGSLSTRRETIPVPPPENGSCGVNSIGCISGIFHFLSRHHHANSPKRLPSAGRKKKNAANSPANNQPPAPRIITANSPGDGSKTRDNKAVIPDGTFCVKEIRRRSCEVERCPTLPSEIRRSSSVDISLDSPRRPSPLVVRLMGLDEIPVSSSESAAEKRRKLLGALEKCDEDLKSLKRIIEAVWVADKKRKTAVGAEEIKTEVTELKAKSLNGDGDAEDGSSSIETAKSSDTVGEQPSPVSVLQPVSSPTSRHPKRPTNGDMQRSYHPSNSRQVTVERLPPAGPKWRERELPEDFGWGRILLSQPPRWSGRRRRRSGALAESVAEVWEEGGQQERGEGWRVVVCVERGVLGDLVEELVKEMMMMVFCCKVFVPQSQGHNCRKMLYF